MIIGETKPWTPILADDAHPYVMEHWSFIDGAQTIEQMRIGFLVKMNADFTGVEPATAADDAELYGVIVRDPWFEEKSCTIAVHGAMALEHVHYADAVPGVEPPQLSPAARLRLREIGIFLRKTIDP
jgi:hypothetical protein